jgi:DME family drug/metabolite transporter
MSTFGTAKRPALLGILLVVSAAALWGTGGLTGSIVAGETGLGPVAIAFYRLAVAALTLAVLQRFTGNRSATNRALRGRTLLAAVLVGVGLAIYQVCYFAAVALLGVGTATLITLGLAPAVVAVGAAAFGERTGGATYIAMAIAIGGLVLLVQDGGEATGGDIAAGTLLAAISATGFAAVTLVSRRLVSVPALRRTFVAFAVGAGALAGPAFNSGAGFRPSLETVALVCYLGAGPTAVAYLLFFAGVGSVGSTSAAVLTLVEPLTATALAASLLGETVTAGKAMGGLALLAAVGLLAASAARCRRPVDAHRAAGPTALGRDDLGDDRECDLLGAAAANVEPQR